MAFGDRFTSAIGQQACKPGAAPGVMLPYTNQQQDMFQPGERRPEEAPRRLALAQGRAAWLAARRAAAVLAHGPADRA
jgi:hypothetical protein